MANWVSFNEKFKHYKDLVYYTDTWGESVCKVDHLQLSLKLKFLIYLFNLPEMLPVHFIELQGIPKWGRTILILTYDSPVLFWLESKFYSDNIWEK